MKLARRLDRRTSLRAKARRAEIKDQFRRGLTTEWLEDRRLMAADTASPYWNYSIPTDVNADGAIAPNDALAIINTINDKGSRQLAPPAEGETEARVYVDVNNDGWVTPMDVLTVINRLNAEGEAPDADDKMEYVFSIANAAGQTISNNDTASIRAGDTFFLVMSGRDLRPEGTYTRRNDNGTPSDPSDDFDEEVPRVRGVYAAYADILFDRAKVSAAVFEQQNLAFPANAAGTVKLTVDGVDTADFQFDTRTAGGRTTTIANMQGAINAIRPTSAVEVTNPSGNTFRVRFANAVNVDIAPITTKDLTFTAGSGTVTVSEFVKGSPTNANALLNAVTFSPLYLNGKTVLNGTSPDRLDELGAFFSSDASVGTGINVVEVLRILMVAQPVAPGTQPTATTLTPDFTNIVRPSDDTLVFGNDAIKVAEPRESSEVLVTQIAFNTLTLNITTGPINAVPDTATVNEDTATAAIDVITNDTLNAGSTGTIELRSVGTISPAGAGTAQRTGNTITFTPAQDFNGTATIEYTAGLVGNTNPNDTAVGTLTVTVNAVNDIPTLDTVLTQNINEDAATTINLTGIAPARATATDELSGQTVQVSAVATTNAALIGNIAVDYTTGTGGTLQFTPAANQSGTAQITVTVKDTGGTALNGVDTITQTFTVNVAAVNDPPENRIGGAAISAANNSVIAPGATFTFTGTTQLSVFDVEAGTANVITVLSLPSGQGTLDVGTANGVTITGDGTNSVRLEGPQAGINTALSSVIYTPGTGFTATLTMATTDNNSDTTNSTINISRDPGVRPFAVDDQAAIDEADVATPLPIDVLANDFKQAGTTTSIQSVTQPPTGQGSVAFTATGLTYTPPGGNFFTPPGQPVTFTYVIDDTDPTTTGSLDDRTGTVFVTINNVNDAPVGVADTFDAQVGQAATIAIPGVLVNDTDVDGDSLIAVNAVIAAGQGSVVLNSNGSFVYTPPASTGTFTFTYQARDRAVGDSNGLTSAPTTVTMRVSGPATATNDTATATEDGGPQNFPSVLLNDDDGDPTQVIPLTATLVSNVPASAGVVSLNSNGTFTYTPAANFNTTRPQTDPITFTYTANAGAKVSNVATVSITVTETNDNPTATNDTFLAVKRSGTAPNEIGVDQPVTVLPNDSFAPDVNETLTVTGISTSQNGPFVTTATATSIGGSVRVGTVNGVATILYTSPGTAPQTDSFFYQISDGRGGNAVAKVDVSVVDFVPKVIGGTVYVDDDNDGVLDANEKRLANVDVRLQGTSFDSVTANNVDIVVTTDINGNYSFGAAGSGVTIKPPKDGTSYTISELQPLYLLSGIDTSNATNTFDHDANPATPRIPVVTNSAPLDNSFALKWNVTDDSGNVTGLNFGERGVDTASLSDASGFIQEFLASSSGNGMVLAAHLSGDILWNYNMPGWENSKSISMSLSSDLSTLILSGVDKSNKSFSVTLHEYPSIPGSMARFRILGIGYNGQYIIRIDGTAAECGLNLLATAPGAGGEGEGQAYANSADALFAQQAWA